MPSFLSLELKNDQPKEGPLIPHLELKIFFENPLEFRLDEGQNLKEGVGTH